MSISVIAMLGCIQTNLCFCVIRCWMSTQSRQVRLFRLCLKCWHGGNWKPLFFLSLRLINSVKHKTDCQRFITDHIHDGYWHYSALCVPKPRPKMLSHTPWDWGICKKSRREIGPEMWEKCGGNPAARDLQSVTLAGAVSHSGRRKSCSKVE